MLLLIGRRGLHNSSRTEAHELYVKPALVLSVYDTQGLFDLEPS